MRIRNRWQASWQIKLLCASECKKVGLVCLCYSLLNGMHTCVCVQAYVTKQAETCVLKMIYSSESSAVGKDSTYILMASDMGTLLVPPL